MEVVIKLWGTLIILLFCTGLSDYYVPFLPRKYKWVGYLWIGLIFFGAAGYLLIKLWEIPLNDL